MGRFPLTNEHIREHLGRLLLSSEFSRSARMAEFLKFVVEHKLTNNRDPLKERTVGIAVFGRAPDWDPKQDTIVRTEARRLRAKLDAYYSNAGLLDEIRIQIPRGGYSAEIGEIHQPPAPAPSPATPYSPPEPRRQAGFRLAFIAALAFGLCAIAWSQIRSLDLGRAFAARGGGDDFEVVPFSTEAGRQFSPAISPDGKKVAFVWDGGSDNFDLYLKIVETGKLQRLTTNRAPDIHPAWSPDGRKIAFLRWSPTLSDVMLKTLDSGAEIKIATLASMAGGWASENQFSACQSPAWSPDGRTLVLTELRGSNQGYGLVYLDSGTGKRTPITSPSTEDQDCYPRFSPDGARLAFVRYISHGQGDIYTVAPDSSSLKRVTFDHKNIRGLSWSTDGKQIVFASNRGGAYELRTVDLAGGKSQPLHSDTASASEPAVAPGGGWIAYVESSENWNLWKAGIETGQSGESLGHPERFLPSSGQNHSPSFSPDGRSLAFVSNRSGSPEIWFADTDGYNLRQITHFGGPWLGTIRWAPDGKRIVFDARPKGHSEIFLMPTDGGPPSSIQQEGYEDRRPGWSRDGTSIYFDTNRSGRPQIWRRNLQTGVAQAIAPPASMLPTESEDGKALFFISSDSHELRTSLIGTNTAADISAIHPDPELDWVVRADGVYFTSGTATSTKMSFYRFKDRTIHQLGELPQSFSPGTPSLDVSPDRKWMIYAATDYVKSDIKMRREVTAHRGAQ